MPRNISFSLTTDQIRNRTKTVTRRKGWRFLKVGDILNGCVKCMGLKPGEQIETLCQIRVIDVRQERLRDMEESDCGREGFSEMSALEFTEMFCQHMGGNHDQVVTRIEFEYL